MGRLAAGANYRPGGAHFADGEGRKPWIQVSAAVFPDANEAYIYKGQDWRGWLKAGYLDAVALMAYGSDTNHIVKQTQEALEIAGEKHVYTGIGAWRLNAQDVAHKIAAIRKTGAAASIFSLMTASTHARQLS